MDNFVQSDDILQNAAALLFIINHGASDHRDAIRAAWLTYENRKHHYDQWERFLIDTGFGRPATAAELLESPELGSVILFRGQVNLLCIVLLSIFYYIAFTHSFLLYFYLL